MTLSARLTVAMVALVIFTVGAVGLVTYNNVEQSILSNQLDRVQSQIRLMSAELESRVRGARADVIGFRAAVALNGIMRATLAGGVDPLDDTTESQWRLRFAARFAAEIAAKPDYAQFRVLGADGKEIVRVDRAGPDGSIRIVPDSELQTKSGRPYFAETIRLASGEVYISPIELNRDGTGQKTSLVPVLRVATPLHASDGMPFGILVIDIDLRPVFDWLRKEAPPSGNMYVANERGDYLVHPDRAREFAFEFGQPVRWQDEFPQLAVALKAAQSGVHVFSDEDGVRLVSALDSVRLADGPLVSILETMPYATVMEPARDIHRATLLVGFAAVLIAALFAALLARSFTRPLVQMKRAVERFAKGEAADVPTDAGGEIGVLAGAFAKMSAEVRDKTDALEQEIEERKRIFEAAVDLILVTDKRGRFLRVSPSSYTTLGYRPEEMVDRSAVDFIHPEDLPDTRLEMRAARRGNLMRNFQTRYFHKDGRAVTLSWTGVWSEPEQRHFFIGRDMTDHIKLEQQLRQSQKMDAIGQLTGGVAHDFNNILTVITGTIEILADAVADKPDLAEITKLIDEAAERGAQLTAQLLAFARKQPLQPRETDINALVTDMEKLLRPTLGEHIEIGARFEANLWPALIDPTQLTTALLNLAVNARDAMPGGGKLMIETMNATLDESYARLHSEVHTGDYVMVAVSDTGGGIPADIREKIFEPFFSTKDVGKGTGLGLSMVYGFVKQSGGHIKLYSEEGHGTTFKLYLPRGRGGEKTEDNPIRQTIAGGSETILVVEDDNLVRTYVIAQLQSLGYNTVAAAGAAEALALVSAGTAFDLLFTDVIMPGGMNGRQLAAEIAKQRSPLKVLFTSGYTENAIIHHGRLDPGVLLLTKPYRKADLARMVRAGLQGTAPEGIAPQPERAAN
jgi:PAS domain S-box-containing protein